MQIKDFYKISIDPEFFNSHTPQTDLTIELTQYLSETLSSEKKIVEIKKNYDYIKYKTAKSDLNVVEYRKEDENEAKRGSTYQITDDMPATNITIPVLKNKLRGLGIVDKDTQNFILQLILQSRHSVHFALFEIIPFLSMHLSNMPNNVIAIHNQEIKLRVSYESTTNLVKISVFAPVTDGNQHSGIIFGEAELNLEINSVKDVELKELTLLIKPLNQLKEELTPKEYTKAKSQITEIFTKLDNLRQTNKNRQNVSSLWAKGVSNQAINQSPIKQNRFVQFINKNPIQALLVIGGILSFTMGTILCTTGIFSPAGALLAALGAKAALSSPLLILLSGTLSTTITTLGIISTKTIGKLGKASINRFKTNTEKRVHTEKNPSEIFDNSSPKIITQKLNSHKNTTKVQNYLIRPTGKIDLEIITYEPRLSEKSTPTTPIMNDESKQRLDQLISKFNLSARNTNTKINEGETYQPLPFLIKGS